MKTIGFIGLGTMGAPMAANLLRAGFDVVGLDLNTAAVEHLVEEGGRSASTIADAMRDADAVITMLPDSPDVDKVVFGEGGIAENARPGLLYIDCSTISPQTSRRVAEAMGRLGVRTLDAPVSGGEQGAIEANLAIMVGGDPADFELARPILDPMGSTIVHVGPPGAGQTVKAANQLIVAGAIQLVAEAIVFLEASGVDTSAAMSVLAGGLAGSRVLDRKSAGMLAREFRPSFRVELHHKDLGILTSAARDAGVVIPVGAVVTQLMASLVAQGRGKLDHSALLLLVEQLSGRS